MEFTKVRHRGRPDRHRRLTSAGNAFRDLKDINVYPSVGMKRPHAQVTVNFGQRPFVFDIDDMMKVSFVCFPQSPNTTKSISVRGRS